VGLLVALLVAGGAAGVLSVSLNCPLPLQRTHPHTLAQSHVSLQNLPHCKTVALGKEIV